MYCKQKLSTLWELSNISQTGEFWKKRPARILRITKQRFQWSHSVRDTKIAGWGPHKKKVFSKCFGVSVEILEGPTCLPTKIDFMSYINQKSAKDTWGSSLLSSFQGHYLKICYCKTGEPKTLYFRNLMNSTILLSVQLLHINL